MHEIPVRCFAVSLFVLRPCGRGHEVLLLRRTRTLAGQWCQVAGGIEADETAWQAALRELHEETSLRPGALYSADICEQFYEADRDAITLAPVFVAFVEADAAVVLNEEHDASRWLDFEAASTLLPFAGQRHVLGHIEREFVRREPNAHLRIELRPGEVVR